MTHAFLYGTGVFEGIRAYWNPDEKQLYALRVKEHIVRLRNSSKIMLMAEVPSVEEFTEIVWKSCGATSSRKTRTAARPSTRAPRPSASSSTA
jgi:branched-subunit amino acid aminotransferase/4-amino-4-deoxychorismate lyase